MLIFKVEAGQKGLFHILLSEGMCRTDFFFFVGDLVQVTTSSCSQGIQTLKWENEYTEFNLKMHLFIARTMQRNRNEEFLEGFSLKLGLWFCHKRIQYSLGV